MSYREKSAWGSLVGLGLVSYWYFPSAFDVAQSSDSPAALFWISMACINLIGQIIYYRADA